MKKKKLVVGFVASMAVLCLSVAAFALTNTGGSTVGQELYTIIVTDFIAGPIGQAVGTIFVVVGAVMAVMGKIHTAVYPLIGGAVLASASTIATSLGAIF